MANNKKYNLNSIFSYGTPVGSRDTALTDNLKGFQIANNDVAAVPPNLDKNGFVFFTRPQLNLSFRNCVRSRLLYNLLTKDNRSLNTFIRNTLDPRLYGNSAENCRSPMVNNETPFIPLLTNTITSLDGWPDPIVPTFTSTEGLKKETHTMIDGIMEYYQEFDLDATFFNTQEDPITHLFYTWERYGTLLIDGLAQPYADFIVENELDYNTRVYRIVTDKTNRYVSKIATTGASIPISVPAGAHANYQRQSPLSDTQKTVTVRFRSNGAVYYDPIAMLEFNEAVHIFNPRLRREGVGAFKKVHHDELHIYNHLAFPYIDLDTSELLWLVDGLKADVQKAAYNKRLMSEGDEA